jgi:hypothetical protein
LNGVGPSCDAPLDDGLLGLDEPNGLGNSGGHLLGGVRRDGVGTSETTGDDADPTDSLWTTR